MTNGCHRMRLKPGKEDRLADIGAGLCTEAYAVQMRAFSRGSDGLAEPPEEDVADLLLPRIVDPVQRQELDPFVTQLKAGNDTVRAKVTEMVATGALTIPRPPARPGHNSLVWRHLIDRLPPHRRE